MRQDKDKAFELRRAGKTYRQIQSELGISISTLSDWFRDVPWSKHLKVIYTNKTWSKEQHSLMHIARINKLDALYKKSEEEAARDYKEYRKESLFWAGLMIYAGEGDKRSKHLVRVTNTEFYLHKIFIDFSIKYLDITREKLRCSIIIYPDLNESLCREMWSNILQIPRKQFHKTQVIQGKEKVKRLQYGIGMSIISSTVLKKKLLVWLSLAQDEKFDYAGMVQG
ncbi:MAG: hypothetical protein AAB681_02505 [Patescibacteria group bacterium]